MGRNHGYALLPTAEQPTSSKTFRLDADEMAERNAWIMGAWKREWPIDAIAHEVGLSVARVKEIINPPKKRKPRAKSEFKVRFPIRTPRDRALADFWEQEAHPYCREPMDGMCMDCFGRSMLVESEYDADGQPYDWAISAQRLMEEHDAGRS